MSISFEYHCIAVAAAYAVEICNSVSMNSQLFSLCVAEIREEVDTFFWAIYKKFTSKLSNKTFVEN